jgi:hypothetical protein
MRTKLFGSTLAATLALAAIQPASAQTAGYIVGSPQATVRGGASADLDIIEGGGSGAASGTVSVKFAGSPFDSARKHYIKFTLAGTPNTNGPLYLRYDTIANSQRQDVSVWTLNQDFAGFTTSTQTWNTAQANDPASGSGFLTTGPFTATYYQNFLSSPSANAVDATHQLNAPWGHMILSGNVIYMALSSTNDIGANGLRLGVNSVEIGYDTITSGSPPSLSAIADLTVFQAQTSVTNLFTVGDPEDGPGALVPTFTSSNEGIVSVANIFFGGTGANRTVYVIGGSTLGTATINVAVVDSNGNQAVRSFKVTVQQSNAAPLIIAGGSTNSIAPTNTLLNTAVTLSFAVSDNESPNPALTVTAEVAAYSAAILQSAVLNNPGGDNSSLSVTVTPQTGADGVGVVRISCSDTNGNINTVGFCVMVRPDASVVFVDHFDYQANNSKLTDDAPGLWTRRNSAAQTVFLRSATDPLNLTTVAWVRPNAGAEDLAGRLADGTYGPGSRAVLYSKFRIDFAEATPGNIITNVNGDSPFFRLSEGGTSTTDFVNLIAVHEKSASDFTLYFSDGNTNFTSWGSDFSKPAGASYTTMTLISRYDVATAKARLWVDATSESDPGINGGPGQDPTPIGYVGLFQERGNGDVYIDDLTVIVKFKPLITAVSAPAGGNVDLDFTAGALDVIGDFQVERASTVSGIYSNVAATIVSLGGGNFRATVAAPGTEGYYKVKRTPITF